MMCADADRPAWERLADELRERILSGAWMRGRSLPSETELSHEFACSRTTVRKAIALLRAEGLFADEGSADRSVRPFSCTIAAVRLRPGDVVASVAPVSVVRANGSFDILPGGTAITCT
jgi:DNA-binding FadR family transcriptional regulator